IGRPAMSTTWIVFGLTIGLVVVLAPVRASGGEAPQSRGSEGGSGRIGVLASREAGSVGKSRGKIGGLRLDQVARLGTIASEV
ncbi:MAG: hypothetical protein JXQ75_14995, partial [Phycisphaerae bacterium]|nr:hypothetical protein [Phycisphaerae bacterium]